MNQILFIIQQLNNSRDFKSIFKSAQTIRMLLLTIYIYFKKEIQLDEFRECVSVNFCGSIMQSSVFQSYSNTFLLEAENITVLITLFLHFSLSNI